MKNLIIGGKGYVGSRLVNELTGSIDTVDLEIFQTQKNKINNIKIDYNFLSNDFLKNYDNIILLAGHSSVRMCDSPPRCSFNNNVRNFVSLLSKLNNNQTLIYASSGSVYGNCEQPMVTESYALNKPYNMYDLTKQMIDTYSSLIQADARVFGLRFGTINGYSPVLRDDVMINAMVSNFWKNNKVILYNLDIKRSILGINDLIRVVKKILESNKPQGGIYNIASFTKTASEIANRVSSLLNCELETLYPERLDQKINEKLVSNKYNFALSCDKFCDEFNFSFEEDIDSIVDSLLKNKKNMIFTNRNEPYNYEI